MFQCFKVAPLPLRLPQHPHRFFGRHHPAVWYTIARWYWYSVWYSHFWKELSVSSQVYCLIYYSATRQHFSLAVWDTIARWKSCLFRVEIWGIFMQIFVFFCKGLRDLNENICLFELRFEERFFFLQWYLKEFPWEDSSFSLKFPETFILSFF